MCIPTFYPSEYIWYSLNIHFDATLWTTSNTIFESSYINIINVRIINMCDNFEHMYDMWIPNIIDYVHMHLLNEFPTWPMILIHAHEYDWFCAHTFIKYVVGDILVLFLMNIPTFYPSECIWYSLNIHFDATLWATSNTIFEIIIHEHNKCAHH